jgi:predicted negative regulator of RcsB-dependent stress response
MIGYETEEQQVQAIKQFWKDNGMAIIAGAIIGLGLLWGWRFYNDSQVIAKEEASAAYNASLESFVDDGNKEGLAAFVAEKSDTGYAPLAAMILAQRAVQDEDYENAKMHLKTAISQDSTIADIARIRLANVHLQMNEKDEALAVLNSLESTSFENQVEELRGDTLLAMGDFDGAQNSYTIAMAQMPNNPTLKMKRDNIAFAKTQEIGGNVE